MLRYMQISFSGPDLAQDLALLSPFSPLCVPPESAALLCASELTGDSSQWERVSRPVDAKRTSLNPVWDNTFLTSSVCRQHNPLLVRFVWREGGFLPVSRLQAG